MHLFLSQVDELQTLKDHIVRQDDVISRLESTVEEQGRQLQQQSQVINMLSERHGQQAVAAPHGLATASRAPARLGTVFCFTYFSVNGVTISKTQGHSII